MATGGTKQSFNFYQNGKYGTLSQNPNDNDQEISQDMHLKMSKKIAQLTKVIYALNTKNDEHESIVLAIREQNEKDLQQVLSETRNRAEHYQRQLNGEASQRKRIKELENSIEDYDRERQEYITNFENFKKTASERENSLKAEHAQRILSLSEQVLSMKSELEQKLQLLDTLHIKYDKDKEHALQKLQYEHKHELDQLRKTLESNENDSAQNHELQREHSQEIEALSKQITVIQEEKAQQGLDFEDKLKKAQAFYENELRVLKELKSADEKDQILALQEAAEMTRKDFEFRDEQSKKRIADLIEQLSISEESVATLKQQIQNLESSMQGQDSQTTSLTKQLADARLESQRAVMKLKGVETELTAARQQGEQQAKDMLKMSSTIGELQATNLQHLSTIKDLKSQLGMLQDRLRLMENTQKSMMSKNTEQEQATLNQLKALEKTVHDMSADKQNLIEKYEDEICGLQETRHKEQVKLTAEHSNTVAELKQLHEQDLLKQKHHTEESIHSITQGLENRLRDETNKLTEERDRIQREYDEMKADLTKKLAETQEQLRLLEADIASRVEGLGSATSHIDSLRVRCSSLQEQLENTSSSLRKAQDKYNTLETEHDKFKRQHTAQVEALQLDNKSKLDKVTEELNEKWSATLRKESQILTRELSEQKDADKQASLAELTRLKEEELKAVKEGWQSKLTELLEEISSLKSRLSGQELSTSSELEKLRQTADNEKQQLMKEMLTSAEQYAQKISTMEESYQQQLKTLTEQKDRERQSLESTLHAQHADEMKGQIIAHKTLIDTVRSQAEKIREADMKNLKSQHQQDREELEFELHQHHGQEMEEISRQHQLQLAAARMELDRALEMAQQKEAELSLQLSDLDDQIKSRDHSVQELEEEVGQLQRGVNDLSRELEAKGKDVLNIRSEANQRIKLLEENLRYEHKEQLAHLKADQEKEQEHMLGDFSEAQEILKDKISSLQILLEEAEDRYKQRDSRPEDIQLIAQLQGDIQEHADTLHKLLDEKRYYQRELVNRETNFNKVFNAAPNVGVMNPLTTKRHKGDKSKPAAALRSQFSSNTSLNSVGSARLDPLPGGSPMHEERINPMKPLPPPKKFVR